MEPATGPSLHHIGQKSGAASRWIRGTFCGILAGLVGVVAGGCRSHVDAARRPTNLVLVVVDTLRWDHTSPAGYPRDTTPFLAHLATESVVFEAASSPTSSTAPAVATLFTGLYPSRHGLRKNGESFSLTIPALASELGSHGYRTSAVVSSFVLNRRFGWARGFENYDDSFDPQHATVQVEQWSGFDVDGGVLDQRAHIATDKALDVLDRLTAGQDTPFFLFVHYFDPHTPYVPPERFRNAFRTGAPETPDPLQEWLDLYDAEILFTDTEIERLVASLQARHLLDSTLLVVTSDHGEGFMEHGFTHHGIGIWEEFVSVPLLVRLPGGHHGGLRITEPVSLADVAPTLADLLGFSWSGPTDGRSLRPLWEDPGARRRNWGRRPIFYERRTYQEGATCRYNLPPWITTGRDQPVTTPALGVRVGAWKYLEGPEPGNRELYDLETDPHEENDLSLARKEIVEEMRLLLGQHLREAAKAGRPRTMLSEEDRARLRSLGYLN